MVSRKTLTQTIEVGILLFLVGAVLTICSMPFFTYTRDEIEQVPRSEQIMNYSFNVHQLQDKMVEVQLSTGQKLNIQAKGSADFNFSIGNFTNPSQTIQPDHPDQIYLFLNDTASVNTTWSPTIRSAQPGNYYLVFLARNASSDFPVQILANVTKTWIGLQTKSVVAPDRRPLIESNFQYLGAGLTVFGAVVLVVTFYSRRRPGSRSHARSSSE